MSNPSEWQVGSVASITIETPTVKTFEFILSEPLTHLAGQHYELRLTAKDGYQAARLYSAASAADGSNKLQLTVALLPEGEVTPYVFNQLKINDQVELRGPLGKFFVWQPETTDPVLLIGGGSGVVPLRCMLQAHTLAQSKAPLQLLYSARTYDEIIYKQLLLAPDTPATITLTNDHPTDWQGATGLINEQLVRQVIAKLPSNTAPMCYVCGSTPFVEVAANLLVDMGIPPARIKAERFGPAAV